jgi:hypothetical protein
MKKKSIFFTVTLALLIVICVFPILSSGRASWEETSPAIIVAALVLAIALRLLRAACKSSAQPLWHAVGGPPTMIGGVLLLGVGIYFMSTSPHREHVHEMESAYRQLSDELNRLPPGTPAASSEARYEIDALQRRFDLYQELSRESASSHRVSWVLVLLGMAATLFGYIRGRITAVMPNGA